MDGTAESRYRSLEITRQTYLSRARDCSELTIPSLIPKDGFADGSELYQPYQGIGARGINNLAAKLSLALMPPNSPFFRLMVEPYTLNEMSEDPAARTNVEKQLGEYERAVMSEIESSGDRVAVHEALKHLIVGGNVLLQVGSEKIRVMHLDSYVVNRAPNGDVLEIVCVEHVSPNSLDGETAAIIRGKLEGDEKTVAIFTHVERKNNFFHVYQEVKGTVIKGSRGKYKPDNVPFLPLRFSRIDGEDYGRGFVEELLGDLRSLEGLSQAIVQSHQQLARGNPGEHVLLAPMVPSHEPAQQRRQLSREKEADQPQDGKPWHQENRDHYECQRAHRAIALGSYTVACQAPCQSVSVPNYHEGLSLIQSQQL